MCQSLVSSSLRHHRLQPTRFLCLWNSPDKDTGVGSYFCIIWEDKIHLKVEQYQVIISIVEDNVGQTIKCISGRGILNSGGLQFSSVQLPSHVRLFVSPWTAACQASLPITNSRRLPKLMSIESAMQKRDTEQG